MDDGSEDRMVLSVVHQVASKVAIHFVMNTSHLRTGNHS
jgi:hypothetical protein